MPERSWNTGMSSGFGDDEAYNVYDKAWRSGGDMASHLYRPSRNADSEAYSREVESMMQTNRFVAEGAERRSGPVEFTVSCCFYLCALERRTRFRIILFLNKMECAHLTTCNSR